MATAYINIGSNIGDRRAQIEAAVAAIEARFGVEAVRSSECISAPWGYESDNEFINLGLAVNVGAMPAVEVHRALQTIQHGIDASPHRNAMGGYADRRIDIDLIAVDDMVVATDELQLPHPRMSQRDFVLLPMIELAPEWRHPLNGLTAGQMLEQLRR